MVVAAGGTTVEQVTRRLPDQRPLTAQQTRTLRTLAATSSTRLWTLAGARNAHATNTPAQMEQALRGGYDVLEGDLRVDHRGRLVMAHDATQIDGMLYSEWLDLVARSGRGVKLDVKDPAAVVPMLRQLARSGVPQTRMILNVPLGGPGATSVSVGQLRLMREQFPGATINLSNQRYPYDNTALAQLRAVADYVGGRVMFPLRSDKVTSSITRQLQPHGTIAAWNQPWLGDIGTVAAERTRLRLLGVNGTIDLRTRPEDGAVRTLMSIRDHADHATQRVRSWLA